MPPVKRKVETKKEAVNSLIKKVKAWDQEETVNVLKSGKFKEVEDNSEALDDPTSSPKKPLSYRSTKTHFVMKSNSSNKSNTNIPSASLLSGPASNEYTSVVSMPAPCMLCTDKSGTKLRLGQNNSEVTEHYKLCLYNLGLLQPLVDAGECNLSEHGQVIDPIGKRFQYKCSVRNCEKSKRTAKMMSYKEFVFHCFQFHGVMERAFESAKKLAKDGDKEKYDQLLRTVIKPERNIGEPEYTIDEIHTCLLCNGMTKDQKENKEGKMLKLNLCVTRNHYASCMHDQEDGLAFYSETYPVPEEQKSKSSIHQFYCQEDECRSNKRFKMGVNYKQFATHNALYHGGLDVFLSKHPREELREMVSKLACSKIHERCYVPDHYGQ